MAIITMPADLPLGGEPAWGQQTYDTVSSSDATGVGQARTFGPPRWILGLRAPSNLRLQDAGVWESMLLQLRGSVNHLAAWHPARPAPRGTLRGTPTLAGAAVQGAMSISITAGAGQAGRTLLPGDLLQLGSGLGSSQLVAVASLVPLVADGSGAVTVPIEPPLRQAFGAGTGVVWDKPLAYFRRRSAGASTWTYANGGVGGPVGRGYTLDLIEHWA